MTRRVLLAVALGSLLVAVSACRSGDGLELGSQDSATPASRSNPPGGNPFGPPDTLPPALPAGFLVSPAAVSITATSLSFSPDGSTLYVAGLSGFVFAYPVIGGLLAVPPLPFLSNLSTPLGVLATEHGVFVSVAQDGHGAVLRARDDNGDFIADVTEVVISGLPIGRHNTNGLALGPDGMLYVANGSSTDSGFREEGGPPETPPFSGSLLRMDPLASDLTPTSAMVVATGFRNPYDLAFVPAGHPSLAPGRVVVSVNGPDGESYAQPDGSTIARPEGEDSLNLLDVSDGVVEHFGFPWCLYDRDNGGLAGFTQDAMEGACSPLPAKAFTTLSGASVQALPIALFGKHVSADGLAFNPGTNFPDAFDGDLFVAEFGNNPNESLFGHKIVRVRFGPGGEVSAVEDFMGGIVPLDLTFGPDGALWIADFSGVILRVASLGAP